MGRTHVELIVCGAMAAVACAGGSHGYTGFTDASTGSPSVIDASFPMDGAGDGSGGSSDGSSSGASSSSSGSGSLDAAVREAGSVDAGGDAAACKLCPAGNVCCTDPGSNDYGTCYSPQCVGCCATAPNGSCVNGGSCGSNESCCGAPGSVEYGQCYPNSCIDCCPGSGGDGGGGNDASVCPVCSAGEVCCSTPGSGDFGRCYPPACGGCCQ